MHTTDLLESLVLAWQEARAAGRDPDPTELCRDHPELAGRLAARIDLLRQLSHLGKDTLATVTTPGSARPTDPVPLPPRIGKYHILTLLGQGGMGAVYWAEDDVLRRPTAIKVLRPDLAARPGAVERFLREARAAAAVEHDAIVPIWHADEDNGVPYIAMPLLRGASLADRLSRGRLPVPDLIRLTRDVASGLDAAHTRGLIHRDVKPANIWLEQKDGDPAGSFRRARLLDFGLARFEDADDPRLTGSGAVLGTPAYMAPEQARGEDADARADLFGLGCVLYHAATGNPPFRAPTVMATLLAVAQEHPPDPKSVVPELPARLADLINRLMSKDRDRRPATAAEVLRALPSLDTPAAAVARPARPTPRPKAPPPPPPRSTRGRWIGIGAAAVLVLGIGVAAVVYARRDRGGDPPPPDPPPAFGGYADLDSKRIPADELFSPWQPGQLVAVVGGHGALVGPVGDSVFVSVSPDGKWVGWSGPTGTRVWEADTFKLRFRGPTGPPARVAFAGDGPDAQALVTLARPFNDTFSAMLVPVGKPPSAQIRGVPVNSPVSVTALALARDGHLLATGTATGEIKVWDGTSRTPVKEVQPAVTAAGPNRLVRQLVLTSWEGKGGPVRRFLVALCHGPRRGQWVVRRWAVPDPPDGDWPAPIEFDVPADVRRVGVHPNGNRVVVPMSGAKDVELVLWNLVGADKPTPTHRVKAPAGCREVEYLNSSPAGLVFRVWARGADGAAAIFKVEAGKAKVGGIAEEFRLPAGTLAVTPDQGRRVVLADGRLTVQNSGQAVVATGPAPVADPGRPPVLVGGRLFTFAPTPQAWGVQDGRFVPAPSPAEWTPTGGPINGSPIAAPGGDMFAWRVGGSVHVHVASPAAIRRTHELTAASPAVALTWGADDQTLRTAHRDGSVRRWDLSASPATGIPAGTVPDAVRDKDYALSPTGTDVFVVAADHKVMRYPLTGRKAVPVEVCSDAAGHGLWPSPSGARLVTEDAAGLGLWDLKTGKRVVGTLGLPARPTAVQWAADERHLLVTMDGLLYVLRVE